MFLQNKFCLFFVTIRDHLCFAAKSIPKTDLEHMHDTNAFTVEQRGRLSSILAAISPKKCAPFAKTPLFSLDQTQNDKDTFAKDFSTYSKLTQRYTFKMHEKTASNSENIEPTLAQAVVGGGIVILIILAFVLQAWPAGRGLLGTEAAPAWLQAIGSIAAIWTAVCLANAQAREQRERKEREDTEQRVRNTSIALTAVSYIRFVTKGIRKDLTRVVCAEDASVHSRLITHRITALRNFAERLDVAQFQNARIAPRYFGVLEAVVALDAAHLESPECALAASDAVLELCTRFSLDFGNAGVHKIRELEYLGEFKQD